LPAAHLEVDFFQAAEHGLASGGDCGNQGGFAPPIHIDARQFAVISFMPVGPRVLRNFTLGFVQWQSAKPFAHLRVVGTNGEMAEACWRNPGSIR